MQTIRSHCVGYSEGDIHMLNNKSTHNSTVKTPLSIIFVIAALGAGCSDSKTSNAASDKAAQDVAPSTLTGIWENRGYGRVLAIGDSVISDYQISSQHCWLSAEIFPHELDTLLIDVSLSADEQTFNTKPDLIADHAHPYTFTKLNALPETCNDTNIVTPTADPTVNYDVLWNTFNDYYAFLELRDVDWSVVDTAARPLVDQAVEDKDLFAIFTGMLAPLADGHVKLIVEEAGINWGAGFKPAWVNRVEGYFEDNHPEEELQQAFVNQTEFDDYDQFVNATFTEIYQDLSNANIQNKEKYIDDISCGANEHICWGITAGNVGYMSIDAMQGYNADSEEQDTADDSGWGYLC